MQNSRKNELEDKVHHTATWFRVPLMIIAVGIVMYLLRRPELFWYGAAISVFGEMIQMWASSQIHKDQKLTISGPYSYVRNPMYIGRFFVFLGIVIMAHWAVAAAYVVFFALYGHIRVRREEGRLREIFGEDYAHYCTEIHRWLPSFKPYSRSEPQRASWKQICLNHEEINFAVVLAGLALAYVRLFVWPGL